MNNTLRIKDKNKYALSNVIIESKFLMSIEAQKIIYIAISKVREIEELFDKSVFLSSKEFISMTCTNDKKIYKKLFTAAEEITTALIIDKQGKNFKMFTWATLCEYTEHENKKGILITFNPNLKPYLTNLQKNYTLLNINNITKLSSKYSIKLYTLLQMDKYKINFVYTISDLRFWFGINETLYSGFAELKRRVLDPAIIEINEKTDLIIHSDFIKSGNGKTNKITSVAFKVASKIQTIPIKLEGAKKQVKSLDFETKIVVSSSDLVEVGNTDIQELLSLGLNQASVNSLIKKYGIDYLLFAIKNIPNLEQKNNPAGYLLKMLDNESLKGQFFDSSSEKLAEDNLEKERLEYKEKKKQEIEDFELNGENLKREFFAQYPEVFTRYIYQNINRSYYLTNSGYPSHPSWSHKKEDKEQNIEIANFIHKKFTDCNSLRDFTNLIKYDESWVFKAFVTFEEYKKANDKSVMEMLKGVKVPFNFVVSDEPLSGAKNKRKLDDSLSEIDIDIINIANIGSFS